MPENVIKDRLTNYFSNYGKSKEYAVELVNKFFDQFLLTREMQDSIDVFRVNPVPLIFTSPGGNCYIDLTMIIDFLRGIIVRAKEWYSTQHGDRFTLSVKLYIERETKDIVVLGFKEIFTSPQGDMAEADLLILKNDTVYILECKAYTKGRSYLSGDYNSIYSRNAAVIEWVDQAKKASGIFEKCFYGKTLDSSLIVKLPEKLKVNWVVCTPSQEFLDPIDKFGMLYKDIPKVCTLEEIVSFLNS